MSKQLSITLISVAVSVCALCAGVQAQQTGTAAHLRPKHLAVVEEWLVKKPNLRLATVADCLNKDGLAATRKQFGKNYHPYYTMGDFNRDKREDFAVALIDKRKKKGKFAVAIFNGSVGKITAPAFFEEGWDLSDGGLSDGGGSLMAGTFESDNCVILRPRGKRYIVKDCLEE